MRLILTKTNSSACISMVLMLLAICSCTSDREQDTPRPIVKIYVGDYPSPITDGVQSRVEIDDNGNASWTDGDEIMLAIQSATTSQNVTLVYTDGEWIPDVYIKPVDRADITAYYAPNFKWNVAGEIEEKPEVCAGTGEYIVYRQRGVNLSASGIVINFSVCVRAYSRLRVYMGQGFAGRELCLNGMTPAGLVTTQSIISIIQSDGCAYYYGSFDGNATLTYTFEGNTTTKKTPLGGNVYGQGYFNNLSSFASLQYIDLGLTSGNKWAKCNLDATISTQPGGYYCWGMTEPSVEFVSTDDGFVSEPTGGTSGGSLSNIVKYEDSVLGANKYKFPLTSDAAYKKLGSHWHVPTYGDWKELVQSCTWTWTRMDGVNGYKITASNGNYIFLPAVGYFYYSLVENGKKALYQCSSVYNTSGTVYSYFISKDQRYFNTNSTNYGLPLRPVYSE